uniref:HDC02445 n=1 Tax=Drosophila melanogaster TaxID=7227 RepID=Q6IHJ9_DROME|nr:TPA_inf: HDC02445 [Drosophila melanogaster]
MVIFYLIYKLHSRRSSTNIFIICIIANDFWAVKLAAIGVCVGVPEGVPASSSLESAAKIGGSVDGGAFPSGSVWRLWSLVPCAIRVRRRSKAVLRWSDNSRFEAGPGP